MHPITSFIKRHALVTFFALAYALSWSISLVEAHSILPFGPLFGGTDALRLWWLVAALWLLIACAVLVTAGRELGRLTARPAQATRVARTLTS